MGAGAYPDPSPDYGPTCHCTVENFQDDLFEMTDLELSGDAGLPAIVNLDVTNFAPTPVVPVNMSGSYENQAWSASFLDQIPKGENYYNGTWDVYLSPYDFSTGGEVVCEDNPYQPLVYWVEGSFDPAKGKSIRRETRPWSCTVGSTYVGDFVLGTMPGQPARGDGAVVSHLFLKDGDPRIVGLRPSRLLVTDPGGAASVEVDGVSYPLVEGAEIPLPRGGELWQRLPVTYADPDAGPPEVEVVASCAAPAFGTERTPTYAVPSSFNLLFGLDQPAVVTAQGSGAERSLMIEAVGLGLRRGLRVDANGRFQRRGEADGLELSGVVVRQDSRSLVLRIETLRLDGVPLLPVATTVTLPAAG